MMLGHQLLGKYLVGCQEEICQGTTGILQLKAFKYSRDQVGEHLLPGCRVYEIEDNDVLVQLLES